MSEARDFVEQHPRVALVEGIVGAGPGARVIVSKAGGPVVALEPVLGIWIVKTWERGKDYRLWRQPLVERVNLEDQAWILAAVRLGLESS